MKERTAVATPSDTETGTLVLGAGLAGLSCALTLDEAGAPYRLVEAGNRVGGLARSETRDGYTFDCTGHWMHLRDPTTRALVERLLGEDALWVTRSAWIWSHGCMVPYPFQTNIWALPPEPRFECLMEFIEARFGESGRALREREPGSFREFVARNLGEGIGRHFMYPYNEKLWTVDLDTLSPDWMGRFVPNPPVEDVLRGAVGAATSTEGYNARFVYPRHGGIQTLSDRLGAELSTAPTLGARAVEVDPAARTVRLEDGAVLPYTELVSTAPLPALVAMTRGAPDAVRDAAAGLVATQLTYVNLGVRIAPGSPPLEQHWVYFPEKKYPFYRAGCASAAVPSLAPTGCRSFYVEFSHRGELDPKACEDAAVRGLTECGLLREKDEVEVCFARTLPYAYVIFDHAHHANRNTVRDWLESVGVRSVGRYGNWEYSSMEDALMAGAGAARAILAEPSP